MLQRLEAIGGGLPFVTELLNKRRGNERIVGERTNAFLDFMRRAGVNLDELRPKVVAEWIGHLAERHLEISEQSLGLSTALHSAYLWSDTRIKFEHLVNNEGGGQLVTHVVQDLTASARGWNIPLNFSGVITGISQIRSVESRGYSPFISFRNRDGLGFDLRPREGGMVFNLIGDQPHA